jgi:hypothetical protein
MAAPRKSSFGIVGTPRRQYCPLIGSGKFAVRVDTPLAIENLVAGPARDSQRVPASPSDPIGSQSRPISPPIHAPCMQRKPTPFLAQQERGESNEVTKSEIRSQSEGLQRPCPHVAWGQRAENSMTKGCGEKIGYWPGQYPKLERAGGIIGSQTRNTLRIFTWPEAGNRSCRGTGFEKVRCPHGTALLGLSPVPLRNHWPRGIKTVPATNSFF